MSWFVSLGGWTGTGILTVVVLIEMGLARLGGDSAAFLYVTFHFIILPFSSLGLLIATVLKTFRIKNPFKKLLTVSSAVVPGLILYDISTGGLWLAERLGVDFNK